MSPLLTTTARPLLKWAGGKGKLLPELTRRLPAALRQGRISSYAEPFIGGGALFFHLAQHFAFERLLIGDVNEDLYLTYVVVREAPGPLLARLEEVQHGYNRLPPDEKSAFYYGVKAAFNAARPGWEYSAGFGPGWVERAAQVLLLNRTCFNGLYRVNARAEFNVPWGKYARVQLADPANVWAAAEVLRRTQVVCGDFAATAGAFADEHTLVYLDPPYRPLSATASFTTYAQGAFGDAEQVRLAGFFRQLHARGCAVLLSNSDPLTATGDDYFERLYAGFTFSRVQARRAINATGTGRGGVSELLITNY